MAEPAPQGIRHVEHVMGTAFSFDIRTPRSPRIAAGLTRAIEWLHHVDRLLSPYRPDSQISRLARGETTVDRCDAVVAEVLGRCAELARATGGYFTHLPGGRLDPSGLVKGWAIERASMILEEAGAHDHCVNGGGDIQLHGRPAPGRSWRIGLADPLDPARVAAVVSAPEGEALAIATSGVAERGRHIVDPHTGRPAAALASLTLVGRHLTEVDALATAAFAMGHAARAWTAAQPTVEALAVTPDGGTWHTPGLERLATFSPRRPRAAGKRFGETLIPDRPLWAGLRWRPLESDA